MTNPMFSIIIPTLNEAKFLPHLLNSLTKQTFSSFEVIVVDGKSRDKTVQIAKSYSSALGSLQVLERVGPGVSVQRNRGAAVAHGEWLVFIDADGACMPYFLERVHEFIEASHPKLVTTWFSADGPRGDDALVTLFYNAIVEGSILVKRPFAPGPLTIVSKSLFDSVGGYDESRSFGEDYEFGARLHTQGITLSILRETLCVYSLRRFRAEGKLRLIQQYVRSTLPVLLVNKSPKSMSDYMMGGERYGKSARGGSASGRKIERSTLKRFQAELKRIVKEIFE